MTKIDCACVLHGDAYNFTYVERLHNMLRRNLTSQVRLHVFTEPWREVGTDMVKHPLTEWPSVHGPRKAWWYKMQMFNPAHDLGRLLYFDLDVVIVRNIDWIWELTPRYFWTIRDFKYLWRPKWTGINSSVMCWDTRRFTDIWSRFCDNNLDITMKKFHGDQDFLTASLDPASIGYLDSERVKSWRWQIKEGGLDFKTRKYAKPGEASTIDDVTSVLVFHGRPKPHEIDDGLIKQCWV